MKFCNPCAEKNSWRVNVTVFPGTCDVCGDEVKHCNESGILGPVKIGESDEPKIIKLKGERDQYLLMLKQLDEAMDTTDIEIKKGSAYHLGIKELIKESENDK